MSDSLFVSVSGGDTMFFWRSSFWNGSLGRKRTTGRCPHLFISPLLFVLLIPPSSSPTIPRQLQTVTFHLAMYLASFTNGQINRGIDRVQWHDPQPQQQLVYSPCSHLLCVKRLQVYNHQ